mmetsp:Transcript_7547/g.22120  ORF Transcript_7547/g.22120 Transcript_7547/m.22120 type:complete len:214 (-) Transcript_7547:285-926(-)
MVKPLQLGVRPQDVQHGPVRLPKEAEAWEQNAVIGLSSEGVGGHGRQEEGRTGPGARVEIVHLKRGRILGGRRGRGAAGSDLGVRRRFSLRAGPLSLVDKVTDDHLETTRCLTLTKVAVLVQTVLGLAGAVQFHAQIEVGNHDLLVRGGPRPMTAGGEDLMEEGQGRRRLGDRAELERPAEGLVRLVDVWVKVAIVRHGGGRFMRATCLSRRC